MTGTIQSPFTDAGQHLGDAWSEAEDDALLVGVAEGRTFEQIAEEISTEINYRSAIACKQRFDKIRRYLAWD